MRKLPLLAVAMAAAIPAVTSAETTAAAKDEAVQLIQQYASSLKSELVSAIKAGGPTNAIGVCQEKAPAIEKSLSESSAWEVGRTSLKTRNPDNAPDAWEQQVLEQFEARKASGTPVGLLSYAAVVEDDSGKHYRYMKAIPTQEVCLTCHGKDIDPELAKTIDAAYPEDQARGYSAGDIRGAFTLSKPL
jgi:hypothetical protein